MLREVKTCIKFAVNKHTDLNVTVNVLHWHIKFNQKNLNHKTKV